MILVIPAIELLHGRCRRRIIGDPRMDDHYRYLQEHPELMALLLRKENARSVHIVDLDTLDDGVSMSQDTADAIERICKTVEIPIELLTKFDSPEQCESWLRKGVFRVVVNTMIVDSPHHVERLIDTYTASRIVLGIRANDRTVTIGNEKYSDTEFALEARQLGIRRVVYSDVRWEGTYEGPDFELVESFAKQVDMRITLAGGIDSPQELWRCQSLQHIGVDSVIVSRALAENRFPCQYIWRLVEMQSGEDDFFSCGKKIIDI